MLCFKDTKKPVVAIMSVNSILFLEFELIVILLSERIESQVIDTKKQENSSQFQQLFGSRHKCASAYCYSVLTTELSKPSFLNLFEHTE